MAVSRALSCAGDAPTSCCPESLLSSLYSPLLLCTLRFRSCHVQRTVFVAVVAIAALAAVSAEVLNLDSSNFDTTVKGSTPSFVKFYAPCTSLVVFVAVGYLHRLGVACDPTVVRGGCGGQRRGELLHELACGAPASAPCCWCR